MDTTTSGCGTGSPCINPIFGPTGLDGATGLNVVLYWSATAAGSDARFAFTVNFFDGSTTTLFKSDNGNLTPARAVRGDT